MSHTSIPGRSSALPSSEGDTESFIDEHVAHADSDSMSHLKEARRHHAPPQNTLTKPSTCSRAVADSLVPRQRDRARLKEFTGALKKAVSAATACYKVYLVTQNCFANNLELVLIADSAWIDTCAALEFEAKQYSDIMNQIT